MAMSDFILNNMEAILQEWDDFARQIPNRSGLGKEGVRDGAREILQLVAEDMRKPQTQDQQKFKSRAEAGRRTPQEDSIGAAHAHVRHRQGFNLNEMVAEYRALRATVVQLWTQDMDAANEETLQELIRFNEALDQSLVEAVAGFSDDLDKARNLLLGTLGHDLRTPLGAVLISAETMLSYGKLDGFSRKAASRIVSSATHIKELIAAVLDVARLHLGGAIPLERRPVDLAELCRSAVDESKAAHPSSAGVELRTSGELQGRWDATRLNQLLSNLIGNAIQHGAKDRAIVLTVTDEGEEVCIQVHNEGKSIPTDLIGQIFEPMTQAEPQRGTGSMGLGLYIVRAVAEAHGGQVSVASSESEGTDFLVKLPKA